MNKKVKQSHMYSKFKMVIFSTLKNENGREEEFLFAEGFSGGEGVEKVLILRDDLSFV